MAIISWQRSWKQLGLAGLAIGSGGMLAACSSAAEDNGSSDNALHISPIGSENESHLTLQLPTDACLPGATCSKVLGTNPSLYIDGASVQLGASTRLKPGTHNVAVNNVGWQVATTAKQNLTVTLPVVDRKCVDASLPNVPKVDFGSSVAVTNAACPTSVQGSATGVPASSANKVEYYDSNCTYAWTTVTGAPNCSSAIYSPYVNDTFSYFNGSTCQPMGVGYAGCVAAANAILDESLYPAGTTVLTDAYQAYAPGVLSATVNGVAQTLTVKAGDEVDFTLNLPATGKVPATFATKITFGDSRDNPDAAHGTITSSCANDQTYVIPAATGTPAPLALNAFVDASCSYTLNVGGRTQALSQTSSNAVTLHRLDVDAVTITREDGTTYTVSGSYSLNYGGVQVAGPYATGTGIDVLPGTYQFSLSYSDFDGPQTQTQTVTF